MKLLYQPAELLVFCCNVCKVAAGTGFTDWGAVCWEPSCTGMEPSGCRNLQLTPLKHPLGVPMYLHTFLGASFFTLQNIMIYKTGLYQVKNYTSIHIHKIKTEKSKWCTLVGVKKRIKNGGSLGLTIQKCRGQLANHRFTVNSLSWLGVSRSRKCRTH